MQTVLLTIWPLLNVVLFGLCLQSVARRAYDMKYNRQTRLVSQFVVSVIVIFAVRQASMQQDRQFTSRQPQPRQALTASVFRHDVLIDSPTYSLKSHLTITPETSLSAGHKRQDSLSTSGTTGALMVTLVQSTLHPLPGLRWEPEQTDVQVTQTGQVSYTIRGNLVWQLLTIPVLRQPKTFTGRSNL